MRWRMPVRRGRRRTVVELTRFPLRDALDEAVSAMLARPGRAGLTAVGTLLGVAAFVAVLGLTATASGQISQRFTALSATEVLVEDEPADPTIADAPFPSDTESRLEALNGVRNAGVFWQPPLEKENSWVSARPRGLDDSAEPLPVTAASAGYLRAVHARLQAGRLFDAWHDRNEARVAVLGRAAAARLGITRIEDQPAVFIGGTPFTVIGIIDHVDRHAENLLAVIVPARTAMQAWGMPEIGGEESPAVLVETELGAAQLIGRQAPRALRPDQYERFKVTVPPDPQQLRSQVDSDLGTLFLALAGICLLIGAVGIANTTLVAVLERTGEIGLRRSLGARSRHIAGQFLTESAGLGLLGGLLGAALGVSTVVATAIAQDWTPILEPLTVLPAPLIGMATGLVAGLYPAWRATRIEPVEALRQ